VKPGNVMIDPEGRIKVMDFGIARAAADDTLTQTGTVLGTAAYLSPEQARGDPVDTRSDIYSLGCVLYEMLSGRPPFTGDSPVSIAFGHVNEDPDPPSAHHEGIPPAVEAVTMRALAKDPGDRFQSADELRGGLAEAVGTGVATAPIGAAGGDTVLMPAAGPGTAPLEPPPPDGRRRAGLPSWLPVALIAAAVLALAGILALSLAGDEERGGPRGDNRGQGEPTEEGSPPPIEEDLPPDQALGAFEDLLAGAVGDGVLTFEAAEKIGSKANDAADAYFGGDLDRALDELGKARDEVDKAAAEGELTSGETATAIHQGIDLVAASMEAAPPDVPAEEEGDDEGDQESSGPGNGDSPPGQEKKDKGKGKGKGGPG
jgi:hypothetical protein